jgi:hypothetical protein
MGAQIAAKIGNSGFPRDVIGQTGEFALVPTPN